MRKAPIYLSLIAAVASCPVLAQQAPVTQLPVVQQADPAVALKKWWPLAHQGDAQAQYELGLLYGTGTGVALDLAQAARWHKQAAAQGHDRAQAMLGLFYNTGQGVPKNQAEAIKWWEKSAAQGNADARFNLGMSYWRGEGVPQDFDKAAQLFRKMAPAGNQYARSVFGTRAEPRVSAPSGVDAPAGPSSKSTQSSGKATPSGALFHQYLAAAENGDGAAQSQVAYMYAVGAGVQRDLIEAHKWANLSASRLAPGNIRDASIANRNAAAAQMSPGDIFKAQERARQWMEAFKKRRRR